MSLIFCLVEIDEDEEDLEEDDADEWGYINLFIN